jgi:hypothetical protein
MPHSGRGPFQVAAVAFAVELDAACRPARVEQDVDADAGVDGQCPVGQLLVFLVGGVAVVGVL